MSTMASDITLPPKYRLNKKVAVMSILIWTGTFGVFTAISVTLGVTTNPMFFLFIIMGLLVSTFAMAFYKPEGPWELMKTWPGGPTIRDPAAQLPPGFLPLIPMGAVSSLSSVRVPSEADCTEVKATSCHQLYGCYESGVTRTNYNDATVKDCPSDTRLLTKASSAITIDMNDALNVPVEKKRRRLLSYIFGRSDEQPIAKEHFADTKELDEMGPEISILFRAEDATEPKTERNLSGISSQPEYHQAVERIEKTIGEAKDISSVPKPRNTGDGAVDEALDVKSGEQSRHKRENSPGMHEDSPDAHPLQGILNSTESSASEGSEIKSPWRDTQSSGPTSRKRSLGNSAASSAISSNSGLTCGYSMCQIWLGSDGRHKHEASINTYTSWDEKNKEYTTPFGIQSGSQGSLSLDMLPNIARHSTPNERFIEGAPSPSTVFTSDQGSQKSLLELCHHSCGDDNDPLRMTLLVMADSVEATVLNNPPPNESRSQEKVDGLETGDENPQACIYVQATSETVEPSVQMGHQVITCDGDRNCSDKKSKRKRLKLLPRFLRGKKKK